MDAVQRNDFITAEKLLEQKSWQKPERNRLLYFLNRGTVLSVNGQYSESNKWFQQADYLIEDYRKNYVQEIAGLLTSPSISTYHGEYFEQILLHYYTTLNYLQMQNTEDALVECKRMMQKMQAVDDQVKNPKKYQRDAFAHVLMGLVYEAQKNDNDAYIAYKNAVEIYRNDYHVEPPSQLLIDMKRCGIRSGMPGLEYAQESNYTMRQEQVDSMATLIVFWNNGLGPVKDQNSINFTVTPLNDQYVELVNWDLGIRIPMAVHSKEEKENLNSLRIIRMAVPKYISRKPLFTRAEITDTSGSVIRGFELVENVEQIAYQCLDDRMLKEMAEAVIRLALKQAAEQALRKQNQNAGFALDLINAMTEQADTRNWQTLPQTIQYARIRIPAGCQHVNVNYFSNTLPGARQTISETVKPGEFRFVELNTLQTIDGLYDRNGMRLY